VRRFTRTAVGIEQNGRGEGEERQTKRQPLKCLDHEDGLLVLEQRLLLVSTLAVEQVGIEFRLVAEDAHIGNITHNGEDLFDLWLQIDK